LRDPAEISIPLPPGLTLRQARPDDAAALQAVVQRGFETFRPFAPAGWEPPDECSAQRLEQARAELADPAIFCLLAEDGAGRVAGHVRWVPATTASRDGSVPDLHLRHLFVEPSWWGGGLARALHARAVAAMHGTARLFTPAGQARARRFYEREGWRLYDDAFLVPGLGLEVVEYRLERGEPTFPPGRADL
jgi:predicted N-acetyltransferase YhbS